MDAIDDATLQRMLALAALEVDPADRESLRRDLCGVLDSMGALRAAPLGDLPPTYSVPEAARTRADEPSPGLDREIALEAAPARTEELFVMPSAMGRGEG